MKDNKQESFIHSFFSVAEGVLHAVKVEVVFAANL
jgi:hypothetical protein